MQLDPNGYYKFRVEVKEIRKETGLAQQAIAELLNTTQPQYSKYESGVRDLPIKHLVTLENFIKSLWIISWA